MYDPDEGFYDYIPTTTDPGATLLIGTLIICVFLLGLLPIFVWCGNSITDDESLLSRFDSDDEDDDNNDGKSGTDDGKDKKNKSSTPKRKGNDMDDSVLNESLAEPFSIASVSSAASSVKKAVIAVLEASPGKGRGLRRRTPYRNRERLLGDLDPEDDGNEHSVYFDGSVQDSEIVDTKVGDLIQDVVSLSGGSEIEMSVPDLSHKTPGPASHATKSKKQNSLPVLYQYSNSYEFLLAVAEWDFETKRIVKLGLPFILQAVGMGVAEAVRVAVIGNFMGTSDLAAYTVVGSMIELSASALGGFQDGLTTLCSQAEGAKNRRLVGQFLQMSVVLFSVCFLPFLVMWCFVADDLMLWFGFDEYTANVGQQFARVQVFSELVMGFDTTIHALLDIIGLEDYSTLFVGLQEVVATGLIIAVAMSEKGTLEYVGYAGLAADGLGLCINVGIVVSSGWFDRYLPGILGSFALRDWKNVKRLLGTAASLSFGYVLTYGEWELLTLFASFLGPAEVAAWALLGTLWDVVELVTEAVADAAEVRCAFLLGSGQPEKAEMSAYKAIYMATFSSLIFTSILFMAGENIPLWLTSDPLLQEMVKELIPLFGIGNITLTLGTMAWTIVGSQGRYRLSTGVGFCGSWLVTMPMAIAFSIVLGYDLQGQTAAVVVGYMASGTVNSYLLMRSNWPQLSKEIIRQQDELEEDDDESSSSSSEDEDEEGK